MVNSTRGLVVDTIKCCMREGAILNTVVGGKLSGRVLKHRGTETQREERTAERGAKRGTAERGREDGGEGDRRGRLMVLRGRSGRCEN
ncbi:MAG: hypothetical protein RL240_3312 [Planctomycetota bacterium]